MADVPEFDPTLEFAWWEGYSAGLDGNECEPPADDDDSGPYLMGFYEGLKARNETIALTGSVPDTSKATA